MDDAPRSIAPPTLAERLAPAGIATVLSTVLFGVLGPAATVLVVALWLAWPLYLATFCRRFPESRPFLRLYLTAVAWQLVHFLEEALTGFYELFPEALTGEPGGWDPGIFVAGNLLMIGAFLAGAAGVRNGVRIPTYIVCFFTLAMVWNGFGHPWLAWRFHDLAGSTWYFPGLLTSPGHLVLSLLLLRALRAAARSPRTPRPTPAPSR